MSAPKFDEGRLMQVLVAPIVSEKAWANCSHRELACMVWPGTIR